MSPAFLFVGGATHSNEVRLLVFAYFLAVTIHNSIIKVDLRSQHIPSGKNIS